MPASDRIRAFVDALPLRPGLRVLEIGCGPGAAPRLVTGRIAPGFILAIDRSARATDQARQGSADPIAAGLMDVRAIPAEDLVLAKGEAPFDLPSRCVSAPWTAATPRRANWC